MSELVDGFARGVGLACMVMVSVALAALAIGWAAGKIGERRDRRDDLVRSLYARELGRSLWSGAWWFPDAHVKRALQLIGISLQMNGAYDVDQIREKWSEGDPDVDDLKGEPQRDGGTR